MSWTRTSDRGQGCPCTRLRFESLEERSLLAVAAFQINLYEDVGGTPGELIADDAVEPDDTFFVEITAREYDPDASGLGGVALDIAWDPESLEEIDGNLAETITENLPLYNGGTLDNEAGTITNLRGAAFPASDVGRPIGNLMFEQFALLHFRALESAEDSSITMEQGGASITTVPVSNLSAKHLDFETQTVHIVSPTQSSSVEEVLPRDSVPVAPAPADSAPTTEPDTSLKSSSVSQPALATPANDKGPLVGLKLNLYEDAGGIPGKSINDGSVEIGESFYVQITAEDLRDTPLGIGGLSVDVSWAPQVFHDINLPFEPTSLVTDNLPLYQSGSLDQDAGRITDLGGVALRSMAKGQPIGAEGPEQFALLRFTAVGAADSSAISLAIGSSGVGVIEGSIDSPDDVVIQASSISVAELIAPPQIAVTATSGPDLESVQFGTQLEGTFSPLVRPALPDTAQFVQVTNTGPSPLTISAIQVNVPDVTVTSPPSGLVLQTGETELLRLKYAPTTPSQNKTAQSFHAEDGLVILSDAENTPRVEIALTGHSTFDADITYDGTVNIADLVTFDDHCGTRSGDSDYHPSIDPNGDGSVDLGDFGPLNVYYRQSRLSVEMPVRAAVQATDLTLLDVVEEEPLALGSEEMDGLAAAVAAAWPYGSDEREEATDNAYGPALPNFMLWE